MTKAEKRKYREQLTRVFIEHTAFLLLLFSIIAASANGTVAFDKVFLSVAISTLIPALFVFAAHLADDFITAKWLRPNYYECLFGIHQVELRNLASPAELTFARCLDVANSMKSYRVGFTSDKLGVIRINTKLNWVTFGETILILVSPITDSTCRLVVSSKSPGTSNIIDYGQNLRNIRALLAAIETQEVSQASI
jgi:hypothetical protein